MNAIKQLQKIGLTKHEAVAYLFVLQQGSVTATSCAKGINAPRTTIYRLLSGLVKNKFLIELKTAPVRFQAELPSVAIPRSISFTTKELNRFSKSAINVSETLLHKDSHTRIDILTGKDEFFKTYCSMAPFAKKEICIISIGEPIPDEIKLVNRDALNKGVSIKFIVHKFDKENEMLLKSYVRMGYKVRNFPDWGYHLVLFDDQKGILSVNNPRRTEERTSMVIYSVDMIHALCMFFETVWGKGKVI